MTAGPDTSRALGDPGDDTARRYQYQWTYAGIMCCLLLDSTEDAIELFCEQHEDVLLKHADGTFSGLQLKTRDDDQRLWSTTDEDLLSSFAKFAKLENLFPGQFRSFRFLTNHPLQSTKNGKDMCHVLKAIQDAASHAGLPRPVLTFLSKVAKAAGCSEEVAFAALRKSVASADLPKRSDVEGRLVATLTPVWDRANECSHSSLQRAARGLVAECGRASSLAHEGLLPAYLPVSSTPDRAQLEAIAFKRFTRERVLLALEEGFAGTATLDGDTAAMTAGSSGSPALLKAKLEAGGFSVTSINSATDLRDKADYLALVWTKKHGEQRGLQRQQHIRSLALRDAAQAFEASRTDDHKFGIPMLHELRTAIQARRHRPGEQLHDCSNEHLEGFVYGLTSECLVLWSTDRPWERNDEHS
jgi:hypothetical protein